MKRYIMLLALSVIAQSALAEEKSLVNKAGDSVKKGAAATERGLEKGGKATVKGLKHAGNWFGKTLQKGGKKLEKASK
ncbi:MAG TPA: hypothetical protein VGD24_09530 [Gallionella sp.]